MKISVAIPTYNRASLIEETLDSIIAQSFPIDEIIVIDDGSTDETEKRLSVYPHDIVYMKISNSGPAQARRQAVDLCKNKWIALCDSDDIWEPHHIKTFVKCLELFSEIEVYFSNFVILDAQSSDKFSSAPVHWWDRLIQEAKDPFYLLKPDVYNAILIFQPIFQSALIFHKDLYDRVGGIAQDLGQIRSEDAHLTRRLISHGRAACCTNPLVKIRKHQGNYSSDFLLNLKGRLSVLERLYEKKEVPPKFLLPTYEEIISSKHELFHQFYWHGQIENALTMFRKIGFWNSTALEKLKFLICLLKKMNRSR